MFGRAEAYVPSAKDQIKEVLNGLTYGATSGDRFIWRLYQIVDLYTPNLARMLSVINKLYMTNFNQIG